MRAMKLGRPATFALAGLPALILIWADCGLILGLDEFKDAIPGEDAGTEGGSTCTNGTVDGDESDVDCGGSCAARCGPGLACTHDEDCAGKACVGSTCRPTCTDDVRSGAETDVDCGGVDCRRCAAGQACLVDLDCNSSICEAGTCVDVLVWARSFGDPSDQHLDDVSVDSSGSVYAAGGYLGTMDFGGGPLASAGSYDAFVAKFDASGQHLWSKRFGDSAFQTASSVVTDASGGAMVAGVFSGSINLGGDALTSSAYFDVFAAKLSAAGEHLWSKRFGGMNPTVIRSSAADSAGNVYLMGDFSGLVDFGGGALASAAQDIFVVKLDSSGGHVWSKQIGGSGSQFGRLVRVDGSGNVLTIGYADGASDFGGGAVAGAGGHDAFVVKWSPAGDYLWAKRFGDAEDQQPSGLTVDPANNIVISGWFRGTIDLGGSPLTCVGSSDMFVAKFDSTGAHIWSKRYDDENIGADSSFVVANAAGELLLAGSFAGMTDFGGGPLSSAGKSDLFFLKLSAGGDHLWSAGFGDTEGQHTTALAVNGMNVVVGGAFFGALDFGGGPLRTVGGQDVFLAKLVMP